MQILKCQHVCNMCVNLIQRGVLTLSPASEDVRMAGTCQVLVCYMWHAEQLWP
jgi:hypothetical protein